MEMSPETREGGIVMRAGSDVDLVLCEGCQARLPLVEVLDSNLSYLAVCDSFVAKCPKCKDQIVLEITNGGESINVGHIRGYGARPDIWEHQHLKVAGLVFSEESYTRIISYHGRRWTVR